MFHFLTKQNYSKYSQISMSMSFSSSEASTMFRSSTASSTSESVIFSKGLSLFLSSRTDNCDFSCWRPAWQGFFGLKQWILSSSDPSFARFSAHDLNDSTITSFERAAHDSNIHWTIFFLGGGFMLPASVYWCTPSAIQWSYFVPMNSLKGLFQHTSGAWIYFVHPPGTITRSELLVLTASLTLSIMTFKGVPR